MKLFNLVNLISKGLVLGLIVAQASLNAQRLCFNKKNGEVRYFSGNCGRGFKEVKSVIRSATIKDGSVTDPKLSGNISWGKINSSSIPNNAISWDKVQKPDGGIPGSQIENFSVTQNNLAPGSVTSSKISVNIAKPLPFAMYSLVFSGSGNGFLPLSGYFTTLNSTFIPVDNSFSCQLFHLIAASDSFLPSGSSRTVQLVTTGNQVIAGCSLTPSSKVCSAESDPWSPEFIGIRVIEAGSPPPAFTTITVKCRKLVLND